MKKLFNVSSRFENFYCCLKESHKARGSVGDKEMGKGLWKL